MKLYFVAGEASGDARGAELMRALRERSPKSHFCGLGGSQMRLIAGRHFHNWCDRAGVIGFIDVLKNYGYFWSQFRAALDEIERVKPDAVVLIDYPGFNLRLAKALRKRQPGVRIIYYISPQVWAWNRRRIPRMARTIDLMICIFPFEKPLYEKSGLKTEFVGHPLLDSLAARRSGVARDPSLVGLFPGSRKREVKKIFPVMLAAAAELKKWKPYLRFEASASSETMREHMAGMLRDMPMVECDIGLRNSHELMQRAAVGMVASGTATLEAAFFRLPYALVYRVAWPTFLLAKMLVKVKWIGIVNILAGREVVHEFIQSQATPDAIAAGMRHLLDSAKERDLLVRELDAVIAMLGESGAAGRAAGVILAKLKKSST
jgi:lipid-A-disaccharide synthase